MTIFWSWVFAAIGLSLIGLIWFGRIPVIRKARTESAGHPNVLWWVTFWAAIVLTAVAANQLPDIL
jgi:hypothetical protein